MAFHYLSISLFPSISHTAILETRLQGVKKCFITYKSNILSCTLDWNIGLDLQVNTIQVQSVQNCKEISVKLEFRSV